MFLARKITRAKWESKQQLDFGEIPADAVTIDLKTDGNALSFWQCPTDESKDIEEAALAIAAARQHVDKLEIVWLDREDLMADGQTMKQTRGHTSVLDLVFLHVDVSRLDNVRLGRVAHRVLAALESNRYHRLTRARVKELIVAAIEKGRIDPKDLHNGLREEVASGA